MRHFPLALRCYLLVIGLAGAVALAASWLVTFDDRPGSPVIVTTLLAMLVMFQVSPEHRLRGAKLSFSTVAVYAAVLLVPLRSAVTGVVCAMLLAELIGRRPWFEAIFNAAGTGLQVFLAGSVFLLLRGGGVSLLPVTLTVASAVPAGVVAHLVNVSLVAGAVAAQHAAPYLSVWRDIAWTGPRQQLTMFAAGGLLALLQAANVFWSIPALVLTLLSTAPLRQYCRRLLRLVGQTAAR